MSRGFTLIEVLIVAAIMVLLALVAIPSPPDNRAYELGLVERQLSDAVQHARYLCEMEGVTHAVVFDLDGDRFAVVDGAGNAVEDVLTRRPYVVGFDRPGQPSGIDIVSATFGANGTAAIFAPGGRPESDGSVIVSCRGESLLLVLEEATGRILAP